MQFIDQNSKNFENFISIDSLSIRHKLIGTRPFITGLFFG